MLGMLAQDQGQPAGLAELDGGSGGAAQSPLLAQIVQDYGRAPAQIAQGVLAYPGREDELLGAAHAMFGNARAAEIAAEVSRLTRDVEKSDGDAAAPAEPAPTPATTEDPEKPRPSPRAELLGDGAGAGPGAAPTPAPTVTGKPDLKVTSVACDMPVNREGIDEPTFTVTVENVGTAPAGPHGVDIRFWNAEKGMRRHPGRLYAGLIGLAAGAKRTVTIKETVWGIGTGKWQVGACADFGDVVAESDETNNVMWGPQLDIAGMEYGGQMSQADAAAILAADTARKSALDTAIAALERLLGNAQLAGGGALALDATDQKVATAVDKWMLTGGTGDPKFWNVVGSAYGYMRKNRGLSVKYTADHNDKTCYAHVDPSNDPGLGIWICTFFGASAMCQREVLTHEYFHFVTGLGHYYDGTQEATKCPHQLAELVFDIATGCTGGCGGGGCHI
jgi:CARDB